MAEVMVQNVAYRATVYRTGHLRQKKILEKSLNVPAVKYFQFLYFNIFEFFMLFGFPLLIQGSFVSICKFNFPVSF